MKYRVVQSNLPNYYQVQKKSWFSPCWVNVTNAIFLTITEAKRYINDQKNGEGMVYYED